MKEIVLFVVVSLLVATPAFAVFGDGKLKEETKMIREDKRELVKDLRASNAAEIKEDREKLKADIMARRTTFKENLKKIRDEKKKTIVEKLDARFAEINEKRTNQMSEHLSRMSSVLDKVTGKDVTAARTAVQVASTAVTAQAAKTYLITITTEANLKMDVGKVRSQLELDLKGVHQLVVEARKTVQAVIK